MQVMFIMVNCINCYVDDTLASFWRKFLAQYDLRKKLSNVSCSISCASFLRRFLAWIETCSIQARNLLVSGVCDWSKSVCLLTSKYRSSRYSLTFFPVQFLIAKFCKRSKNTLKNTFPLTFHKFNVNV